MEAAREHIQAAHGELEHAEPNKGGHRERAIALLDQALGEVNAGIEFARSH
jgi:inosine/xanthosine triphosphate pyrophosphatase family protein